MLWTLGAPHHNMHPILFFPKANAFNSFSWLFCCLFPSLRVMLILLFLFWLSFNHTLLTSCHERWVWLSCVHPFALTALFPHLGSLLPLISQAAAQPPAWNPPSLSPWSILSPLFNGGCHVFWIFLSFISIFLGYSLDSVWHVF